MQKLEMNEKIKEIDIVIWSIYDLKKKKRKLTKNSNICTWSFDQSKVSKSVEKKIINPKEKLFYKWLNHMWL